MSREKYEIAVRLLDTYLIKMPYSAHDIIESKYKEYLENLRMIDLNDVMSIDGVTGGAIQRGRIFYKINDKLRSYDMRMNKKIIIKRIKKQAKEIGLTTI